MEIEVHNCHSRPVSDPARIGKHLGHHAYVFRHVSQQTYEGVIHHILHVGKAIRRVLHVVRHAISRAWPPIPTTKWDRNHAMRG
jgi:hypothetical protein